MQSQKELIACMMCHNVPAHASFHWLSILSQKESIACMLCHNVPARVCVVICKEQVVECIDKFVDIAWNEDFVKQMLAEFVFVGFLEELCIEVVARVKMRHAYIDILWDPLEWSLFFRCLCCCACACVGNIIFSLALFFCVCELICFHNLYVVHWAKAARFWNKKKCMFV